MPVITGKKYEHVKVSRPNGTRYAEGTSVEVGAIFKAIASALDAFASEFNGDIPGEKGFVIVEATLIGVRATAIVFELPRE